MEKLYLFFILGDWGIGDWGLGIGDWGLGPIPNAPRNNKNLYSCFKFLKIILFKLIYL